MMKNLRNSALVVAALTAATFTSAPQRAAAQTYQIDCAILLCLSGGWPASVPCARARAEFIRRITPWPVEPPLQIWRCPMGAAYTVDPDTLTSERIYEILFELDQSAPLQSFSVDEAGNPVTGSDGRLAGAPAPTFQAPPLADAMVPQGDKIFRFAPTDFEDRRTHRYNPLLRISELKDQAQQQMELQLLASLFLQNENERVQGLLKGGIDLFVAAGLLAFQRKKPTLGEIYRIAASGGNKQKEYMARGVEVQNEAAKLIFTRLASTNNDTLTSYVSLLMTSGLDQWQNPAIDAATQASDFDFRNIRKEPFSVYLIVQPLMVEPMAPLIRLFFSDLLASMQDKEPGPDEPWPVMIMLDEFNKLGKMPIVSKSIETLRSYRGHLAIVTQTIPALDEIYGENTRRALQGNAGVKLYLTPSDEKTVEELSKAVGKTTKKVVTRSRAIGKNPFEGRSQSVRTEEVSLLPEDEARRLPLEDIVMVIDAQMPIRAKRIEYFNDPYFKRTTTGAGSTSRMATATAPRQPSTPNARPVKPSFCHNRSRRSAP